MKSNSYSIKHSVATFAALCVLTNLSFGSSCQSNLKNDNGCNPYEVNFIQAKTQSIKSKKIQEDDTSSFLNKLLTKSQTNINQKIKKTDNKKSDIKILAINKPNIKTIEAPNNIELKKYKVKDIDIASISKVEKSDTKEKIVVKKVTKIAKTSKVKKVIKQKVIAKKAKKKKVIKIDNKINKDFYVVKKGDTLISIAKQKNISIAKLREINRLSRSGHIKIGQKLYFKNIHFTQNSKKVFDLNKNIKYKKAHMPKFKKHIRVVATAYTSHRGQTDKTPFLAAWNNKLKPGMKIIAVSHDLIKKYGITNGVKVKLKGLPGLYTVRDKMNKRFKKRIDIYMGVNKRRALRWGKKKITLYW